MVVAAVVTEAVPEVFVTKVVGFVVDVVAVVACKDDLDRVSVVLGHLFDQSVSGAVVISLMPLRCSFLCGMTIVY